MAKIKKHQCCKRVYSNNTWHERDGKWYCGIHDPVKIKAKDDARQAEEREKQNGKIS